MGAIRSVGVEEFVEGLRGFEQGPITKDRVSEYCSDRRITSSSLERFLTFRPDRYTRNQIFRDPLFELMVICWEPGQVTPVHSHNGQLGWMFAARGGVEVTNYRYRSCNAPENQNVVGLDCLGGATALDIEPVGREETAEGGPVSTVDKIQTIHRIGCPAEEGERSVTVHIYSTPFDSCVAYDLEKSVCYRRNLFWDTRNGEPADSAPPPPSHPGLPLFR